MSAPAEQQGIDLVALYIAQQGLITEAKHSAEEQLDLCERLRRLEELLTGKEGLYTELKLMQQQHKTQQETLDMVSSRSWHLILLAVGQALLFLILLAWEGWQAKTKPPQAVPPIVVPYKEIR